MFRTKWRPWSKTSRPLAASSVRGTMDRSSGTRGRSNGRRGMITPGIRARTERSSHTTRCLTDLAVTIPSFWGKPSDHTNRQCAWNVRMARGDGMAPPAPRPLPLTGSNAIPLPPPPAQAPPPNAQQANINVVEGQGQGSQPQYQEQRASYVVFVTKPNDKKSRSRRQMEVNAVMPAVPKYMHWSEQQIT